MTTAARAGNLVHVLSAEEMPDDNVDIALIQVDFPRLDDDSATSCPVAAAALIDYLTDEVPNGDRLTEGDLQFQRTADAEGVRYWIWAFDEPDGDLAYVTVSVSPSGASTIGYDANFYALTPEEFILGDYHEVF